MDASLRDDRALAGSVERRHGDVLAADARVAQARGRDLAGQPDLALPLTSTARLTSASISARIRRVSPLAASSRKLPAPSARRRGMMRSPPANPLAIAHSRFARAALTIYLATAAISVTFLVVSLATDKAHEEDQIRERLLVGTDIRAHSLGQHLGLLVEELRRLGLRSEVDLHDEDHAPEISLLKLSHERSTFFNLGVAILDPRGEVVSSEPHDFLQSGSFGGEKWFSSVRRSRALRIVPVHPDRPDAVLYVVSPLLKNKEFAGALLGGVDLARGEPLADQPTRAALTVLAAHDGAVIYPPAPPRFSTVPAWRTLFGRLPTEPFSEELNLDGSATIVAASPVSGTDLVLMTVAKRDELFHDARARFATRLSLALGLALAPIVALVFFLRRSLAHFQRSEEDAVREERLRLLGEAANSIAHEVKNTLNGLSMGLDLVVRRDDRPTADERRERVLLELRREIKRLADFTTELMTFSKGIEPRVTEIDLCAFVPEVTALLRDAAAELGVEIALHTPDHPVTVEVDQALFRAVISNLVGNALDAATGGGAKAPAVEVRLDARGASAELRVRDTGAGVSESMSPRLFEPFQTEKPNGVGIGLALARKIAHAHGGDLVHEGNDVKLAKGGEEPTAPPPDDAERRAPDAPRYRGACFLLTLPLEGA